MRCNVGLAREPMRGARMQRKERAFQRVPPQLLVA